MIGSKPKNEERGWHPDFRDVHNLPDIKLVRTDFLLNFIGVICLLVSFVYFGLNFFEAQAYRSDIKKVTAHIEGEIEGDKKSLALNNQFIKQAKLIKTFNNYFYPEINVLDYLLEIGNNNQEKLLLTEVYFEEKEEVLSRQESKKRAPKTYYSFSIKGNTEGDYDASIDKLNNYMEILSGNELIKKSLEKIEMTSLKRDDKTNLFTYEISLITKLME